MVFKKLLEEQKVQIERTKDRVSLGLGKFLEGRVSATYDLADKSLSVSVTNTDHEHLTLYAEQDYQQVRAIYYKGTSYARSEDEEAFKKADEMLAEYKTLLNFEENLARGVELPVKPLSEILDEF